MLKILTLSALGAATLLAQAPHGEALFKARCGSCHQETPEGRIPSRGDLAGRTPETVMSALFGGIMSVQAAGMAPADGRAIARFLTGKDPAMAAVDPNAGLCTSKLPALATSTADWNGAGGDMENTRYQPKPGLAAADVPKLKLKWAFGFPGDRVASGQPTVVGGRVFVGSAAGTVYSLDVKTGCTVWSYKAEGTVRSSISVARAQPGGPLVAYFGDIRSFAHAVDAETGKPLWKVKVEDHAGSRVTGAPIFHNGRLYVPVSSIEEALAQSPKYECCTFRGSLVALDGSTGKQIWKSYTVPDPAIARKLSKVGTQLRGPAGAAIWSAPTIDAKRNLIYVATGDSYTDAEISTSDAVVAFDMTTGKIAWSSQVTEKDNFVMGCPNNPNCPESDGPDYDFGTSPILRNIGGGKQLLVVAQKSGILWAMDPDQKGKVVWQNKLGTGGMLGGIEWGHAADEKNAYVAVSDRIVKGTPQPGLSAVNLADGKTVWSTPSPKVTCATQSCQQAQSAPVAVIPGAVFSGTVNGHFRAYSTATGAILWDYDTARTFTTINKVEASGGSIDAAGPVVANGIVLTNSGFAQWGGIPGNVLLAFSVDGKQDQ